MIAIHDPNHRIVPPYGMAGGEEGQCGKNWVERADGTIVDMTGQDGTRVDPGDVFVLQTPTGSGYGPTSERVELAPETAE
jgi:5-oxoprolinase (ATP-hydrolysing)